MMPRTILGYAKLYADEAANGHSLEAQIAEILNFCQHESPPWPKPSRILAEVEIATADSQVWPGYLRLCQADLVLVTAFNRLSRDAVELATIIEMMMVQQVRLVCIHEQIDTLDAEDWKRARQFIKTLWDWRSEAGKSHPSSPAQGSSPRGFYAFTRLPNGTRVPDPDVLPWLKLIYRLHAQGVPLTDIAFALEEGNAPLHAGQRWRHRVVQRILGLKYRRFYVSQFGNEFWRHDGDEAARHDEGTYQ